MKQLDYYKYQFYHDIRNRFYTVLFPYMWNILSNKLFNPLSRRVATIRNTLKFDLKE